jgi:S-DNA-T family DNA segregation ATPase FtsK/SpoIIIE
MFDSDDVVSVFLEAIVRFTWLTIRGLRAAVVSGLRHPALTIVTLLLAGITAMRGPLTTLVAVGVVTLLLGAWRLGSPASFQRVAAPGLAAAWWSPWYRMKWRRVAARNGLVAHDHTLNPFVRSEREVPRLVRVRVTPNGVRRLLLRLPAGLTPGDVAARADGLAHALRCREVRVVADRPGRLWLEVHVHDVLRSVVAPSVHGAETDLTRIPIGIHEDGSPWTLRLKGTHVLVAGATGSGKGSIIWSLLNSVSGAVSDGTLEVWTLDPKGGMELRPGMPLFSRFEDQHPDAMCRAIEELVQLKDFRAARLATQGQRTHSATASSPHILLVVDELATLTAFAERTTVRRIEQALGLLLTQGRACGITVLAAVQDPGKDVVAYRDLFPTRIALRLDNPIQVDMVLGEGARDMGAAADHISELTPGVAFVRIEGTRALRRVRAAYLDDQDIAALADRAPTPHGRTTAPGGEAA